MPELPDFDVTVWLLSTERGKELEKEILSATDEPPHEATEEVGILDINWDFDTWSEAVSFLEPLKRFKDNPNLILLKASNHKRLDSSIVLKDDRYKS